VLAEQALDDEDTLTCAACSSRRPAPRLRQRPAGVGALLRRLGDTLVEIPGPMNSTASWTWRASRVPRCLCRAGEAGEAVRAAWHVWRGAEQRTPTPKAGRRAARRDEDFPAPRGEGARGALAKRMTRRRCRDGSSCARAARWGEAVTQSLAELSRGRAPVTALRTATA